MNKDQMTHKSFNVDLYTDKGFFCAEISYESLASGKETAQLIAGDPWQLGKRIEQFFEGEARVLLDKDRKKYLGISSK